MFIQAIFSFLKSSGDLKATKYMTFNDLSVGIPALIICGEMAIFSILFQFSYSSAPYAQKYRQGNGRIQGTNTAADYGRGIPSWPSALVSAINVSDLLKAVLVAPAKLVRGRAVSKQYSAPDYIPLTGRGNVSP